MKASFYIATFCLISLNIFLVYSRILNNPNSGGKTSITISENADNYMLSAYFNVNKTAKVQEYINKCLKPNSLFGSVDDNFDVITTLTDKTELHIKELPGELEINLDKSKNSAISYDRVKRMCEGVKDILGQK
jgi:hypothetical protein